VAKHSKTKTGTALSYKTQSGKALTLSEATLGGGAATGTSRLATCWCGLCASAVCRSPPPSRSPPLPCWTSQQSIAAALPVQDNPRAMEAR
jgi:hypothetical protein